MKIIVSCSPAYYLLRLITVAKLPSDLSSSGAGFSKWSVATKSGSRFGSGSGSGSGSVQDS